jgi:ADP-ribose pyrophosphatase YjhB (NUDIX family)
MSLKKLAKAIGVEFITADSGFKASDAVQATLDKIYTKLDTVPYIQYPVAFHTVDIIATRQVGEDIEVLLGRKHKHLPTEWVFIGGFVEPMQTAESAALRELHEESNVLVEDEDRLVYLGSMFIDDARYADSCHKITTSIFTLELTQEESEQAKGGDDIAEVKFVKLDEAFDQLRPHHKPLFEKLIAMKSKWQHSKSL